LRTFEVSIGNGRRIAWLYAHGDVVEDVETATGSADPLRRITVRLNPKELGQFEQMQE
jgi:GTP-binding protein HflX